MDMSFTLKPRGRAAPWVASLADIEAAAEQHRDISACGTAVDFLRGQDCTSDLVHALACVVAPETRGLIDAVILGGSFNPSIARQLLVGKRG